MSEQPRRRARGFLERWLVFAGAVVVWEIVTRISDSVFFPPPSKIAQFCAELWFVAEPTQLFLADTVYEDILPSLARALGGWLITAVVGISLGLALGRSRIAYEYLNPLVTFLRSVPPPALIPVFMVAFGIGTEMQIATIVFGALWPVLLNSVDGARSVDRVKTDTARSFRISRAEWIRMVVFPAALPKIFAGLRTSLAISLILMVMSELVSSNHGIGYRIQLSQNTFSFDTMWAWLVLLGALGYLLNNALLALERRMLGWQPKREAAPATAKAGG
ncbi:ABC transporter permease [Actinoalloteichus spitiensis]|uniref:ABC transporter permease n=1 Tax=Actinoalloteichus spitiensis TaxID=252394 RepID=UPI0002F965F8|nr:ABC transporter permease [Actinoalloteichus spitiensis]